MSNKLVNRLYEGEEAKTLLEEASAWIEALKQNVRNLEYAIKMRDDHRAELEKQNAELLAALGEKQALIDSLMLEYCPDDMSPEQIAEWARHQKPSTQEVSK